MLNQAEILIQKLGKARREGKATPDIFNQFNELTNDDVIKPVVTPAAIANGLLFDIK